METENRLRLLRFEWKREEKDLLMLKLANQRKRTKNNDERDYNEIFQEEDLSDFDVDMADNGNDVVRKHMDVTYFMTNKNENDIDHVSNKLLSKDLTTFLRRK